MTDALITKGDPRRAADYACERARNTPPRRKTINSRAAGRPRGTAAKRHKDLATWDTQRLIPSSNKQGTDVARLRQAGVICHVHALIVPGPV